MKGSIVSLALILAVCLLAAARLPAQTADTIVIRDCVEAAPQPFDTCVSETVIKPQYSSGRIAGTAVVGCLGHAGGALAGAFIGGLAATPFVDKNDEWVFLGAIPFVLGGGVIGGEAGGALVIHGMNKKYVDSSPWNALGGMILHYAAGAGLIYLLRADQRTQEVAGWTVYLTAPISGTAAYFLLGKPKRKAAPRTAHRP